MLALIAACAHPIPSPPAPTALPEVAHLDEADLASLLRNESAQLLVVNFWATWCGPCIEEMGALHRIAAAAPAARFALVSVDSPGSEGSILPFAQRHRIVLPIYFLAVPDSPDTLRRLVPAWPDVIPVTLVVEPGGSIRRHFSGRVPEAGLLAALAPAI